MKNAQFELSKNKNNKLEKTATTLLAGTAILAAGLGLAAENSHDTKIITGSPEMTEANYLPYAAEQIANKYRTCVITDVVDTHALPKAEDLMSREKRTTLMIAVTVERNPDAATPLEKFDEDNGVEWKAPMLHASVTGGATDTLQVPVEETFGGYALPDTSIKKNGVDVHAASETLKPVAIYPLPGKADGATMTFTVDTMARTATPESAASQEFTHKYACEGKAVWREATHSWELVTES